MVFNSTLLLIEKVFASGTKFAVVFYGLEELGTAEGMGFIKLITYMIFLFTFCHFGTDNLIYGKRLVKENCDKIYLYRLIGTICSVAGLWIFFDFKGLWWLALSMGIVLFNMGFPYIQNETLLANDYRFFIKHRSFPEVLGSTVRVIALMSGSRSMALLLVAYFFTDILMGVLNFRLILQKIFSRNGIERIKSEKISCLELASLNYVVWSMLGIALLFFAQRGDVFLLSNLNDNLTDSSKFLIKSQQLFDASGIVVAASVPLVGRYVDKPKKVMWLTICGFVFSFVFIYLTSAAILLNQNFSEKTSALFAQHGPIWVAFIVSLGIAAYMPMMFLNVKKLQKIVFILLAVVGLLKLFLFYLFYRGHLDAHLYSALSLGGMFLVFYIYTFFAESLANCIGFFNRASQRG